MRKKLKNVPIRLRIATLAVVAVIFMIMLSAIGFMTASSSGKIAIAISFVIGSTLGILVTHEISLSILEQIREVNRIMENVADGNLDVAVAEADYTKEEFGILFVCINHTLNTLRNYINYIDEISVSLNKIADGYINVELKQDYKGEFALLKESLTKISHSLSDTVKLINESTVIVAEDSNSLAVSAHGLSNGATDQASVIEELSASITSVSELVTDNSTRASIANKRVGDVKDAVNESNNDMKQLLDAMNNIKISSGKVVEIIAAIQGIASQTNLLSLNASIESARAGESGRGFAVVAARIGELANQSISAAKSTAELIAETIDAVNAGAEIAGTTDQSLQNVVKGTSEITSIMNEIAIASRDQSEALSQISEGVDQIANVVDGNVNAAKVSSDASDQLKKEVQKLQMAVVKFKL